MWQLDDEDDLAKKHGMHIYRVKGVVALEDSDKQHWLQGVHNMFDFTETALVRHEEINCPNFGEVLSLKREGDLV
tara:strand:+ start:841 stop:1065 length:225 start_codon:yes stop_codon:yes gene_type:complete